MPLVIGKVTSQASQAMYQTAGLVELPKTIDIGILATAQVRTWEFPDTVLAALAAWLLKRSLQQSWSRFPRWVKQPRGQRWALLSAVSIQAIQFGRPASGRGRRGRARLSQFGSCKMCYFFTQFPVSAAPRFRCQKWKAIWCFLA